jgi:hypothetical protein
LLAACVTSAVGAPDRIVRGCWIDRTETVSTTMRWLPDRNNPATLVGETLTYGAEGPAGGTRYSLERRGEGWVLCRLDAGVAPPSVPCWPVSGAPGGPVEPGRVVVQGSGEHLHITRIANDEVEDIFVGRRDGCD